MIINVETALPTRLVKLLVDAFDASLFDENDVPGSADVLGAEDIKARLLLWSAVIDDACKHRPRRPCLCSRRRSSGSTRGSALCTRGQSP